MLIVITGKEYWMGLENIYRITNMKKYTLRITMKNFGSSKKLIATYKSFSLTENVSVINIVHKISVEVLNFKSAM